MQKKGNYIFYSLLLIICIRTSFAQSAFWFEDFGYGCSQGNLAIGSIPTATNGPWVVYQSGLNGLQYNNWFISATEAGQSIGDCGDGCLNTPLLTNRCLHISSDIPPNNIDVGAVYARTASSLTNRRAVSSVIDCSLKSNMVISFNYLSGGNAGVDFAECECYDGISWNTLGVLASTIGTCAPKGTWVSQSYSLPISANSNPSVYIGFNWTSNAYFGSSLVSVAIDNISISGIQSTGINELISGDYIFRLFPNPIKDKLNIELLGEIQIEKISVTNYLGQVVYILDNLISKHEIDLSVLPSGIYFLTAKSKRISKIFKIIKE